MVMTTKMNTATSIAIMFGVFQASQHYHDLDGSSGGVHAFQTQQLQRKFTTKTITVHGKTTSGSQFSSLVQLHMGLYDAPLPPRPSPNNDNNKDDDDDDDGNDVIPPPSVTNVRLFQMEKDGSEKRNLLPRLKRRLDIPGIGCYYEETDRKVQNVMDKTNCHPLDACWSLEAHRGNVRDAWESISVAQRMLLNEQMTMKTSEGEGEEEVDWDEAWKSTMEAQEQGGNEIIRPVDREAYEKRKAQQQEEEKKRNVRDLFNGGGTPDQPYLPKDSFGPDGLDSDEPWFTG
mmetsp:Transcript_20813/g.29376  ORF Transcript_20813/g.29376 Transcript_20813/m.29376 type:complete len:288 (+) Transcript_20813:59-922(+)